MYKEEKGGRNLVFDMQNQFRVRYKFTLKANQFLWF